MKSSENNEFTFQFWDIGGQERYIYMTHVYYKNADFCLIMFDLTSRDSFKACAKWKRDLDDKHRMEDGSKCPCLLIGNKVKFRKIKCFYFFNFLIVKLLKKSDIPNRELDQFEIEDFCRDYGKFFPFIYLLKY